MATTEDRPDTEELYETASNTSNLKCSSETRGAVDYLIAAGWAPSRLGMALLRLHSAYDAAEKPERREAMSVKEWRKIVRSEDDAKRAHAEQRAQYEKWYRNELEVLLSRLAAFPSVREQLTVQAMKWGMGVSSDPITRSEWSELRENDEAMLKRHRELVAATADDEEREAAQKTLDAWTKVAQANRLLERKEQFDRAEGKAAATIRYWLSQHCSACSGTKWQLIPGTMRQSDKPCMVCLGGGYTQAPHGQDGRKLANYMDKCLEAARTSLRRNLSNYRKAKGE
jgi:hypothetical protein